MTLIMLLFDAARINFGYFWALKIKNMRKIAALFFTLAVILFAANNANAQKAKTEISSVKQKGETVRFTITSSKPLIFGSNRYILYIGERPFSRSDIPGDENNRIISFLINADEFNSLKEGANIYFSYGQINVGAHDMEDYVRQNRRCWSLGKFSKTMLKK
jgi:hypothetical protein